MHLAAAASSPALTITALTHLASGLRTAASLALRLSSRRWSSRSRRCTSCAHLCSMSSNCCRPRSVMRFGLLSGWTNGPVPDRFLVGLAVLSALAHPSDRYGRLCSQGPRRRPGGHYIRLCRRLPPHAWRRRADAVVARERLLRLLLDESRVAWARRALDSAFTPGGRFFHRPHGVSRRGINVGGGLAERIGVAGGDMRRARGSIRWHGLILTAAVLSAAALVSQAGPGRSIHVAQRVP
jgi:hypothetical protein